MSNAELNKECAVPGCKNGELCQKCRAEYLARLNDPKYEDPDPASFEDQLVYELHPIAHGEGAIITIRIAAESSEESSRDADPSSEDPMEYIERLVSSLSDLLKATARDAQVAITASPDVTLVNCETGCCVFKRFAPTN